MSEIVQFHPSNLLLAALSALDRKALLRHLEFLALPVRMQLELPGKKIDHVYFVEQGIVSITAAHSDAEVGIIGREGMTGLSVMHLDDRSPYGAYMQVEGSGYRIGVDTLLDILRVRVSCHRVLLGFAKAFLVQTSETAVANARASMLQRLARWLLMAEDRLGTAGIPLTHEFLAMMVGTCRPGVTEACHELARRGLIHNARAKIAITDRPGLEGLADGFYGKPEAELRRILANMPQSAVPNRSPHEVGSTVRGVAPCPSLAPR
jgi:CRP-like cAMP-binding protein